MITSIKNKALMSLLITIVLSLTLFDLPTDMLNLKIPAFFFAMFIVSYIDYQRGYLDGKAFYTKPNPELTAKATPLWDHRLSLHEVIERHPFCLMELDHAPCVEHDYPLPMGVIHLVQNEKYYTTLTLTDDGWTYTGETNITKDQLNSGKYQPMMTRDAMRISQDKIWDLHF